MVAENARFMVAVRQCKRLIEQGALGALRVVQTWQYADDAKGLIPMVQAFRDSIRTGQEPEMSGAEGLRDLAVVLKAYESMAQGVSLPL